MREIKKIKIFASIVNNLDFRDFLDVLWPRGCGGLETPTPYFVRARRAPTELSENTIIIIILIIIVINKSTTSGLCSSRPKCIKTWFRVSRINSITFYSLKSKKYT